jgi:hypothetical protein
MVTGKINAIGRFELDLNQKFIINFDDQLTNEQFATLNNFLELDFPTKNKPTEFFCFLRDISSLYQIFYKKHQKLHSGGDNPVKFNLDSSDLDAAISKADLLISKLKTAQSLMSSISNK